MGVVHHGTLDDYIHLTSHITQHTQSQHYQCMQLASYPMQVQGKQIDILQVTRDNNQAHR